MHYIRLGLGFIVWAVIAAVVTCGVGCATTKQIARDSRPGVVDCTTAGAAKLIEEFTPTVKQAVAKLRDGSGKLDKPAVMETFKSLGRETGACVAANMLASALSGLRPISGDAFDTTDLMSVFDEVRRTEWGGAKYKTDAGTL